MAETSLHPLGVRRAPGIPNFEPTQAEADALIERARRHAMGIEYLENGALDSVAATFQVHAFTVELARQRCRQPV